MRTQPKSSLFIRSDTASGAGLSPATGFIAYTGGRSQGPEVACRLSGNPMKRQRGLVSLTEVLIVLIIIGLLTPLVVEAFSRAGDEIAAVNTARAIKTEINQQYLNYEPSPAPGRWVHGAVDSPNSALLPQNARCYSDKIGFRELCYDDNVPDNKLAFYFVMPEAWADKDRRWQLLTARFPESETASLDNERALVVSVPPPGAGIATRNLLDIQGGKEAERVTFTDGNNTQVTVTDADVQFLADFHAAAGACADGAIVYTAANGFECQQPTASTVFYRYDAGVATTVSTRVEAESEQPPTEVTP